MAEKRKPARPRETAATGSRATARRTPKAAVGAPLSAEDRARMVAEAAYYRAEKRGFCGGCPEEDWLEAEKEIDARLAPVRKRPRKVSAE